MKYEKDIEVLRQREVSDVLLNESGGESDRARIYYRTRSCKPPL